MGDILVLPHNYTEFYGLGSSSKQVCRVFFGHQNGRNVGALIKQMNKTLLRLRRCRGRDDVTGRRAPLGGVTGDNG